MLDTFRETLRSRRAMKSQRADFSCDFYASQRRRDDNKNKILRVFEGGSGGGRRKSCRKTLFFVSVWETI